MKRSAQIVTVFLFGTCLAYGQKVDRSGYELAKDGKHLIPVLHEDLTGFVRCGNLELANARVELLEIGEGNRTALPDAPKVLDASSTTNGSFRFAHVADGDWRLVVRSRCDGRVRHAEQVVRVKPLGFSDCVTYQIIVDIKEGGTQLQKHETSPCF